MRWGEEPAPDESPASGHGELDSVKSQLVDTVAGLGGDEFGVVARSLNSVAEADSLAVRLAEAFRAPFAGAEHELRVSASVGQAILPGDGETAEDLLQGADASMFRAKRSATRAR